eukprot:g2797.t1
MAAEGITPRVLSSTMASMKPQTDVILVGRVKGTNDTQVTLTDAEGQDVTVIYDTREDIEQLGFVTAGAVIEIVGRLQEDKTVYQFLTTQFSGEFDFDSYKRLCQLWTGKFNHIFSGVTA